MKMEEWRNGQLVFLNSLLDVVYTRRREILRYSNTPLLLADKNLVVVK